MFTNKQFKLLAFAGLMALAGCNPKEPVPAEVSEDTYAGGELGTTFNTSATAYEDPTPATEQAGLTQAFKYGEAFFECTYTQNNPPSTGWDRFTSAAAASPAILATATECA